MAKYKVGDELLIINDPNAENEKLKSLTKLTLEGDYAQISWGLKTYKVTKNTLSVSGLKRRTRYYIRMRAVRHTKAGNYYGAWSSVKNRKTK